MSGGPSFTKKTRNTGKTPKYRKDPEIPERPVNGSIHAQVSGGGRRFILILKKCFNEYIRILTNIRITNKIYKDLLFDGSCL